ncbi:MAG TPA: DUF4331 family protein [Chthoniobacteraceae bacterium]|jgi:hypothetical protein
MKSPACLPACAAALALALTHPTALRASDHADGPTVAGDQAADLADCYFFQDPNDATKVVLINTVRGFIVPGEAANFAIFDSTIRYRFQIENTDDAKPDAFIDISFSEKNSADPQTATVKFSGAAFPDLKGKFTGETTSAGLGATPPGGANYFLNPAQKLKAADGTASTVEFFGGETDDPFFFDIPGFIRFRNIILDEDPTTTTSDAVAQLGRGRDTFAGYNVMTIALRIPKAQLVNTGAGSANTTKFGLNVLAQRGTERVVKGRKISSGAFKTVDREGLPAVNALLIPLALKNAYNGATTMDDASGKFAEAIVGTLKAVGTSDANVDALAGLAVVKGDILRLDLAQSSGFPNGRLPADDVVKTLLTIISNSNESNTTLDDNVPANEVAFENRFPYLGLPHQPLPRSGTANQPDTTVDPTRN